MTIEQPDQKATLEFIYTNEFGDRTEIKIDLMDTTMHGLYWGVRQALAGCGFAEKTIDEWFGEI
jgi:hypothetical protein